MVFPRVAVTCFDLYVCRCVLDDPFGCRVWPLGKRPIRAEVKALVMFVLGMVILGFVNFSASPFRVICSLNDTVSSS